MPNYYVEPNFSQSCKSLFSDLITGSIVFRRQLVVIPDPSIFLGKDSDINMPVVSINIRDTDAPNDTSEESASFVTTLSNVNNDPPKEDVVYCMNLTGLDMVNFAYQVTSKESAYRFDLKYPTVDVFLGVSLR